MLKLYANNPHRTFWSIIIGGRHLPARMFGMVINYQTVYMVYVMYLEDKKAWKMTWRMIGKMRRVTGEVL